MTSDEVGRLQEAWKAKGDKPCTHARVVDYFEDFKGKKTGNLVCQECGAVFPDPFKQLKRT